VDAAVFPSQTFPGCHGIKVHATAYYYQFLARDSIYAIARSLLKSVRPSVCLSVYPAVRHTGGSVKDGS